MTPHNSGYAYSLTDPTNLGTRTYSQLDTFVQQGGGWTALCHSILSNENNIADLTRNGSPAVKSLFKTSLAGGLPGGFLTTNGFPVIDNTGGTWTINPTEADLPTAQMVPDDGRRRRSRAGRCRRGRRRAPRARRRTGRAPSASASSTRRRSTTTTSSPARTTTAPALGKLTYIGGHSFSTSLPYCGNSEAPYLRAFYNSLFFNGSAVAKLDLTLLADAPTRRTARGR